MSVMAEYPDFNPKPWNRTLRAYYDDPYKLIEGSDGRPELYNLDDDPGELRNLISEQPQVAGRLATDLRAYLGTLEKITTRRPRKSSGPIAREYRELLEALGYVGTGQEVDSQDDPNEVDDQERLPDQP